MGIVTFAGANRRCVTNNCTERPERSRSEGPRLKPNGAVMSMDPESVCLGFFVVEHLNKSRVEQRDTIQKKGVDSVEKYVPEK